MNFVISIQNLKFAYDSIPILKNVNIGINNGDFASITGANGAGKSTLIKLLLGELCHASGKIEWFGKDIKHFKKWTDIGYVPQHKNFNNGFPATVKEIVMSNLYSDIGMFGFPAKRHKQQVLDALDLVGMKSYANTLIGNLSGGQQQRVSIAKTLVSNPKVLLLDEPTAGIDSETVTIMYELLKQLNKSKGTTIVMVTHDTARALPYVNRTFCIENCSMVELNKTQVLHELSHKHKHPVV